MAHQFVKTTWRNGQSPAITAEQLNRMEDGIEEALEGVDQNEMQLWTPAIKAALLSCLRKVAWFDDQGQSYYDALEAALYENEYPRITAVFNPGANVIYTDDALSALAPYLTVTYYETITDPGTVVAYGDYTLAGTLNVGANLIRVAYNGLRTTFEVTAVDYYNIHEWSIANGLLAVSTIGGGGTKAYNGHFVPSITNASSSRRCIYAKHGNTPFRNNDNTSQIYSDKFPVPIPDDATTMSVSITPNTQWYGGWFITAIGDQMVDRLASIAWYQGNNTIDIPAGTNRMWSINLKYDSAGTSYPVEPSELSIVFS